MSLPGPSHVPCGDAHGMFSTRLRMDAFDGDEADPFFADTAADPFFADTITDASVDTLPDAVARVLTSYRILDTDDWETRQDSSPGSFAGSAFPVAGAGLPSAFSPIQAARKSSEANLPPGGSEANLPPGGSEANLLPGGSVQETALAAADLVRALSAMAAAFAQAATAAAAQTTVQAVAHAIGAAVKSTSENTPVRSPSQALRDRTLSGSRSASLQQIHFRESNVRVTLGDRMGNGACASVYLCEGAQHGSTQDRTCERWSSERSEGYRTQHKCERSQHKCERTQHKCERTQRLVDTGRAVVRVLDPAYRTCVDGWWLVKARIPDSPFLQTPLDVRERYGAILLERMATDLFALLWEPDTLSEDAADALSDVCLLTVAADVVSAVLCLHEHGIAHRDIKPENVMVGFDGRAQLGDLDFATTQHRWGTEAFVGTVMYAPELVARSHTTHRAMREGKQTDGPPLLNTYSALCADVYSLALTVIETLTHKPITPGPEGYVRLADTLDHRAILIRRFGYDLERCVCAAMVAQDMRALRNLQTQLTRIRRLRGAVRH
jgi:hypothetical protein